MPPSRHSSSHHSSSRSHSSHSHHSSSHHSSSSGYSSGRSGGSFGSGSHTPSRPYAPVRKRVNQPTGWKGASGTKVHYHLYEHDYDYYPESWTDEEGRDFREGYYDENGNYYANILADGATTMLKCEYCGNRILYTMKEGDLPSCDKCGSQFDIQIKDKVADDKRQSKSKIIDNIYMFIGLGAVLFYICMFVGVCVFMISGAAKAFNEKKEESSQTVYVEEILRNCSLDGEDWYDPVTETWFWFNDEEQPYQWQYWVEGISSDYGDYGWMEYDPDESAWYIETSDGVWTLLPDKYDASSLWHMNDEYTNQFEED